MKHAENKAFAKVIKEIDQAENKNAFKTAVLSALKYMRQYGISQILNSFLRQKKSNCFK